MSSKRSRAAYEVDLQAQQSPYVLFGTPLPPHDPEVRDDGSFVPVWKQEVKDERGRKRFHGAFTGGWSAGYYNTVGSKEGWTPANFVSSRTSRHKEDLKTRDQRPEDFMDDEDMADAEDARKIQTSDAFAGLGTTGSDATRAATGLAGLFHTTGETMGVKLLQKMGWKPGQGIGPKAWRKARLDLKSATGADGDMFLFAPENVPTIHFSHKLDRIGLGYYQDPRLVSRPLSVTRADNEATESDEAEDSSLTRTKLSKSKSNKKKPSRGGIGIGVLNDTGSDDEDPFELGPKISYNKVIGGDRKKKHKGIGASTNPSIKSTPVFVSRKNAAVKSLRGLRRCHDGRLPMTGFTFGVEPDPFIDVVTSEGKYPPPTIPSGWKSARVIQGTNLPASSTLRSTAEVARESKLNPTSRAEILGENQLPGKSVFDFLSVSARDRLATTSGNSNLPVGKGEIPAEYAMSEAEKLQHLWSQAPKLDTETAVAALKRGAGPGAPYAEDEIKRTRYRKYLEYNAGYINEVPRKPTGTGDNDWLRELHEFYSCARIFKPMTGAMASRFTTSSSSSSKKSATAKADPSGGSAADKALVSRPAAKPVDPAEEAARMGMYGQMTRYVEMFYPSRLLCKRFNVKPPAHVRAEAVEDNNPQARVTSSFSYGCKPTEIPSSTPLQPRALHAITDTHLSTAVPFKTDDDGVLPQPYPCVAVKEEEVVLDVEKNEALEGKKAQEEVFKAIFGDSDDEEDEKE